jgi:hypothetical protein
VSARLLVCAAGASLLLCPAALGALPAGCDAGRPAIAYAPGGAGAAVPAGDQLVPCRHDTGGRAMEPSLDFTRDGRVLFQEWQLQTGRPNGAPVTPAVFRSDAALTRWEDVSPQAGPVHSLDPYLIVDRRTGRIFSVNFLADGGPTCATVSFSDDDGASWTSSPAACEGFDGESLGVGPPAGSTPLTYPDVVYYCTGNTPASSQPGTTPLCSKSLDGGLTFVPTGATPWPPADPDAQDDKFGPWAGNPVVADDGTVYVPKRFAGQPEVAISHDEGASWTRVTVASNGSAGATPRIAVDAKNHVFYAWNGADHHVYLAVSSDAGKSWGAPIDLTPPGVTDTALPRPAATGDGRVFVAYLGSTNAPGKAPYSDYCNILLSPCDDGAYAKVAWNGYMTAVDGVLAGRPRLQTATVSAPDRPLLVGMCSADGGCKGVLDFIDAKYSPAGEPFAAFVDDCKLERDFIPAFGEDMGRCSDNLGEGIVGRLVAYRPSRPQPRPCRSARRITVHVPRRWRGRATSYDVVVDRRVRRRHVRPGRGAVIDLRGHRAGVVVAVLRIHLRGGRIRRDVRRYRLCVPGPG